MNYDKKLKRILAFILAAALVITYMPSGMKAYALGESDQPEVTESVAEESAAAVSEPSDDADEEADEDIPPIRERRPRRRTHRWRPVQEVALQE